MCIALQWVQSTGAEAGCLRRRTYRTQMSVQISLPEQLNSLYVQIIHIMNVLNTLKWQMVEMVPVTAIFNTKLKEM